MTINRSVRITDVSDWEDWERPDMNNPYEVVASPAGETISRSFSNIIEAEEFADEIANMTGTYNTSWGEQPYNNEVTIIFYVIKNGPYRLITTKNGNEIDVHDDRSAYVYQIGTSCVRAKTLGTVLIAYNYYPGDNNIHYAYRSGKDAIQFIEDSWIHGRTIIDVI